MTRIIIMMICTSGVIFGGHGVLRRWVHKQRMRRNARYNRKLREAYKRRFKKAMHEMGEPETWRDEERAAHQKFQTVEYRTELARAAENEYLKRSAAV